METISLWKNITKDVLNCPNLNGTQEIEVVIIGAGITGLTTALELTKSGKKVAILEANQVGEGTTGFSTGNLYIAVQPYFQNIASKFDEKTCKIIAESRKQAIDYIENIIREYQIDCNFARRPWYLFSETNEKLNFLMKEYNLLKKIGMDVRYTDTLELTVPYKKAFLIENQARFNPLQYCKSLASQLLKMGCQIFENSRVIKIENNKDTTQFHTENGMIVAKKALIATHTPIGIHPIQLLTAPYRSYVVAVKLTNNTYPEGNFWNLEDPHFATSTHCSSQALDKPDLLMVAGSHHKTGQDNNTESHFKQIEAHLEKNYPVEKIVYRWSAQHYHAADDIPYIGITSNKNVYQATGYFADGLVYGTLAGILIGRAISETPSQWNSVYNPKRKTVFQSAGFFLKENLNVFSEYLQDLPILIPKDVHKIKKGEAELVQVNQQKFGIYRDETDTLHIVSAVCPHMKCIVNWNNAEKTWDCPCHGSRFSCQGKLLEGPAQSDLTKIDAHTLGGTQ